MKNILKTVAAVGAVAIACSASAITINFSTLPGGSINFDGAAHFKFSNPFIGLGSLNQQSITTVTSGAGDSIGDKLWVNGTYTIGAVSTFGGLQVAPVTGAGDLYVVDHLGKLLHGSISWSDMSSFGSGNTINFSSSINLVGVTYPGAETDLLALVGQPDIATVTLQWTDTFHNLTYLKSHVVTTSDSGSISPVVRQVPDGGLTIGLLGLALVGIEGLRRRLSK